MPYIPNTDDDRRMMLEAIGVDSMEALLKSIPEDVVLEGLLKLPSAASEMEVLREMEALCGRNKTSCRVFAGGGIYDHFVPSAVLALAGRPEFVTAYTPYQAEVSQGTLQVIYEFQTHICRLTGMDAANASMYDGASAAAEAALLSLNTTGRDKVIVSETVNPLFREVIRTYLSGRETELVILPHNRGHTDLNRLEREFDDRTAGVILSQPNFFGLIEDIEAGAELSHRFGGHLIVAIDPISAVLLKTPGACGADIVVGEGQPLGIPMNFGGPLLGFFAVRQELIRRMPGRLAARTTDAAGNPGFVLTLQTREQHIRRDKATSNICTNQALCAAMATFYISLMGRKGLRKAALLSMERAHEAAERLFTLPGFEPYFEGDFIREFAIRVPGAAGDYVDRLVREYSILPGINAGRYFSDMDDCLITAFTEKRMRVEIDDWYAAMKELSKDAVLSEM